MLWIKAFHIIFMVTWFAGLFYLPRLFVYHCTTNDAISIERFKKMEHKLLWIIMTPGAIATIIFGVALMGFYSLESLQLTIWLHIKLGLVAILIAYHIYCIILVRRFKHNNNTHSQRWYRIFNEVPALLLISIIILAVVKPI